MIRSNDSKSAAAPLPAANPRAWIVCAALLLSGVYVIFLSGPGALGSIPSPVPKILILVLPWGLMWVVWSLHEILDPHRRVEVLLMLILIVLGALNVLYSENVTTSSRVMTTFLLTGPLVVWTSLVLFRDSRMVHRFDLFCCVGLGVLAGVEIIAHAAKGFQHSKDIGFFVGNAIPTGTVAILLLPGPLRLITQELGWNRALGWTLLLMGLSLIALTQRRGSILAVFGMLLFWAVMSREKWAYFLAAVFALIALIVPWRMIPLWGPWDPRVGAHFTALFRIELFFFAAHVFWTTPWVGMGVRTYGYTKYLADYQLHDPRLVQFPVELTRIQTLDNMLLTLIVEFGVPFTLAYLSLIGCTLYRSLKGQHVFSTGRRMTLVRLLPLVGLAIHSMTYDSLLSPPVNWLFSIHVGILAAGAEEDNE